MATFTEQARRRQLIEVTIAVVARHGYAGCSLQRIADEAKITKPAVIYHFASKQAVITAAYEFVIAELITRVGSAVESADSAEAAVEAYLTSMINYFGDHPDRVRMITETLVGAEQAGVADHPAAPNRYQGLAELVRAAQASGSYRDELDPYALAIILSGAVDGIAGALISDPTLDLDRAIEQVLSLLRHGALRV